MSVFFVEQVHLVEDDDDGHAICFGTCQEAVYEGSACFGMLQCDHQSCLVHVGRYDVALLGEIGGLAYDIVAALLDVGDIGNAIDRLSEHNPVAYSHRVGATYAFEPEVALDAAIDEVAFIGLHDILAAGVLDYDSELDLWFSGIGRVHFEFSRNANVTAICKMISERVL